MAWPKGKSRVGYVRQDGQPHATRGSLLRGATTRRSRIMVTATVESKPVAEPVKVKPTSWTTKLTHPSYIIEECPNCEFPEADGGFCQECGWSQPLVYGVKF